MKERDFWRKMVAPALNTPDGQDIAEHFQDAFKQGLPDVLGNLNGHAYLMELKVLPHAPVREDTEWKIKTSVQQRRYLTKWARSRNGRAMILVGLVREREWVLLRPDTPRSVAQSEFSRYVVARGSMDEPQSLFNAVASYTPRFSQL